MIYMGFFHFLADQATARAYRIGLTRTVNVYYPGVISDDFPSFDVRLDALLGKKRALASDMLNGYSDLSAGGCGVKPGLVYAANPRLSRYSRGLSETREILMRFSLYQRM